MDVGICPFVPTCPNTTQISVWMIYLHLNRPNIKVEPESSARVLAERIPARKLAFIFTASLLFPVRGPGLWTLGRHGHEQCQNQAVFEPQSESLGPFETELGGQQLKASTSMTRLDPVDGNQVSRCIMRCILTKYPKSML